MVAIKDLVQIVKEFRENMDNVNDAAFGPSNPNAKKNPYIGLYKGKTNPVTEEHRVLQGSYELLHSHGLIPTEELAKHTLVTIRSYLEDLSESLTMDYTDVHPSLRDVYRTEDPKLILRAYPDRLK